jgi:D-amino-acid dehydrogenase
VTDQQHQVSISRLGKRVRVTGGAELGGTPNTKSPAALATLYKVLRDWFPGAASLSGGVQEWKGARAMLPDGLPILGASGIAGVWLNLGHGTEGWALSCGSARILADLIGGTAPGPDISALGISRISR